MSSKLYRKAALDRMSSPEQIDRLINVTSAKAWLVLVTLCVFLAAAIAWGFLGELPTRVQGNGILLTEGGRVFEAVAPSDGTVSELTVEIGDQVSENDVVAVLSQRDTRLEYQNALSALEERKRNLERIQAESTRQEDLREQAVARQIEAIRQQIAAAQERRDFLQQKVRDEQELLEKGFSTRTRAADLREQLSRVEQSIADARQRIADVRFRQFEGTTNTEQRIANAEQQVREAERRVDTIAERLERGTRIRSPESGRVTEIQVSSGTIIRRGQTAISFESEGEGLELLLYVPPQHGKNVEPGMEAQVSPNTAESREFGTIVGEVVTVSDFPATPDGMRAVLQNDNLVRQFSQRGAPYRVVIRLARDPNTVSGYEWTSDKGGDLSLSSGTISTADITVRSQKPITMVIPLLREWTGL